VPSDRPAIVCFATAWLGERVQAHLWLLMVDSKIERFQDLTFNSYLMAAQDEASARNHLGGALA
jgi:hypothetical protein